MAEPPDSSPEERLLERFWTEFPDGNASSYGGWAEGQPELLSDAGLRERVLERFEALRDATYLQTDGGIEAAQTNSFFRRRKPGDAGQNAPLGSATLVEGSRIGPFVLTRFLAKGGMGQVWVAEDQELKRSVALKLVLPDRVEPRMLELFAREARAGGRLAHRNLVTTLAFGSDEGMAWIAQELIEGSWTLKDLLDERRASDTTPKDYYQRVAEFVAQVAEGLQAAHDAGVIHRDIKPQNILIAPDNTPKVTDFGLARVEDDSFKSHTGDFAGTWAYMSPEQVTAKRIGLDHRTDIFSLGVVMYEMLALRRPFEGDTTHQIAEKIITLEPLNPARIRSQCPAELAIICGKALQKAPGQRYQNAKDLAADIRRHLVDEPIHARPPGALTRGIKWAKRHRTASVAVGVGLVALAIVSALAAINASLAEERTEQALLAQQRADENAELARRNLALAQERAEQARIAEANAEEAKANAARALLSQAEAETERANAVRLAVTLNLQILREKANMLWPPYPANLAGFRSWLETAEPLIEGLSSHRPQLAEVRGQALARSDDDLLREREDHRDFKRLAPLQEELAWKRGALALRRGDQDLQLPILDRSSLPKDQSKWNSAAQELVKPNRSIFGQEALGLAIAMEAMVQAPAGRRAALLDTVAWGRLAVGDDEGAMAASRSALGAASDEAKAEFQGYLDRITWNAEMNRSSRGLVLAAKNIATLAKELRSVEAGIEADRTWLFPDTEEGSLLHERNVQLSPLIEGLEALERDLVDPQAISRKHGWSVSKRLEFAERLKVGFRVGGEYESIWRQDLPAIRTAYPGLELPTQVGLVPLGVDPQSGLWEFWHIATGDAPVRDEEGQLVLSEETGVVLVLIAEDYFWMGASRNPDAGNNYDPDSRSFEGPVHEVKLSAYFLSKYEMTQGQWLRATGREPSVYKHSRLAPSLLHPVENVSWTDCVETLERMGLSLPSEAQWERGCRAETQTVWWHGSDREDIRGRINIADKTAADDGAPWPAIQDWPDHEDGGVVHREVGSYPANAFGLHEVHGNVVEWCLDGFDPNFYTNAPLENPVSSYRPTQNRVCRGGGFSFPAPFTRSACRIDEPSAYTTDFLGLRPAMAVSK